MKVGEKIKSLRLEKKYSISELSEKAKVSKSYLSYIERGIQENPSLQVLSRLADNLDTTVEYLMGQNNTNAFMKPVDEEWAGLVDEAIKNGISKEDFAYYLDFMKFTSRNKQDKQ
ncbi:helix-turn-helix domain-containing protein [Mesobacillus jeotgali]|jgi:XRE family transcriptional regulator, master regulator for biofilm formation|uniref:Helix-turn-helix domain-containing protein n=1 Tax=Mesobacillus jeotgali TaxID=129985 RepID=A0ABY9VM90_9BACI|nr:helix-turn-helix domain-containing protein [Mesobacillus jeotgali]WNF23710.1 helix-turn-helix domain-containing protein [Mesobacillus jeotgali]